MKKSIIGTVIFAILLLSLSVACLFLPKNEYSSTERRLLAQFPELNKDTVMSGSFMKDFESYSADQFPFREEFRTIKSFFSFNIFRKLDKNDLFVVENHISKIDNAYNQNMIDYATTLFSKIYEDNIKDKNSNVYLSIVPDKNYFLAEKNGYPVMDYDKFIEEFKTKNDYMQYIDIVELLSAEDYYYTDTHWKQENIIDVANKLTNTMSNISIDTDYKENVLEYPFAGVYFGQLSMPFKKDTITYLTNETIENFVVKYYDTGKPVIGELYNLDKAFGKDSYEMFLSGVAPLITIENKDCNNDRELILFRDSFGSSIAPIIATAYSKVTIVDIRYMQSSMLNNFVDFKNKDILFLYSTSILNNSTSMR
jgi:hypothetical protein